MQRLAGRRFRASRRSISASSVSAGARSTKPMHPRISAASCWYEPSRIGCRKPLSAVSARSGSASFATSRNSDGGFSDGTMERPALQRLLADIRAGRIDVVGYKVDRLTRSLADFAPSGRDIRRRGCVVRLGDAAVQHDELDGAADVNVLLSFAQFEREVTGERIPDKIAASKKKSMWMGGNVPLGYDADERALVINPAEAETVPASSRSIANTAACAVSTKRPTGSGCGLLDARGVPIYTDFTQWWVAGLQALNG
jgi:DNA invertase Pin-like site-specific DNA recombinase